MTSLLRNAVCVLALVTVAIGCKKDEDRSYDGLFNDQSSSVNTKSVFGVWGNKKNSADGLVTFESRIKLQEDQIMVATRCTQKKGGASIIVGVTGAATITQTHIKVAEAKSDQKKYGNPEDSCYTNLPVFEEDFTLTGGKLGFAGDVFDKYAD